MLNRLIVLVVFIQAVHGQDVPGKTKKIMRYVHLM